MTLTTLVIKQLVIMLLLIITGTVCFKIGLITTEVNKKLSALVLNLINPVLIITSYQMKFQQKYLTGLLITFGMAAVSFLISILIARITIRGPERHDVAVERFAVVYSNCGFIGIPLVNGMLGAQGVFYLTSYLTVFNLLVWTHGVMLMKGERSLKQVANIIKAPAVIATVIGLALFVLRFSIPSVLLSTLSYLGGMNTPMAMLVAGATIAQTNVIKSFGKPRIYLVTFLKLIAVPVVTLLIFVPFHIDSTILLTVVTAAASPVATTGTLFAIMYGKNSLYASELFTVTTILSVITLPLTAFLFTCL